MNNRILASTSLLGLLIALCLVPSATAQPLSFSVGPQISTLGVGVAAHARVGKFGVSAEYNLLPITDTDKAAFDNSVLIEPTIQGGLFMVTLHPTGGKFAVAAGLQTGGMSADMLLSLDPSGNATIAIGDGEYAASDVGDFIGVYEFGTSVQPAFMLGWIGQGFNFALGASIAKPELEFSATGFLKDDSAFLADVERHLEDFYDVADDIPVYPYLRLGWQFGF